MSDPDKDFYPAWRFHPTLGMQLVPTRADDEALKARDAAWVNTPADLAAARAPSPPPTDPVPAPYTGDQTAPPVEAPPAPEPGDPPDPAPKRTHHKKKAA